MAADDKKPTAASRQYGLEQAIKIDAHQGDAGKTVRNADIIARYWEFGEIPELKTPAKSMVVT